MSGDAVNPRWRHRPGAVWAVPEEGDDDRLTDVQPVRATTSAHRFGVRIVPRKRRHL